MYLRWSTLSAGIAKNLAESRKALQNFRKSIETKTVWIAQQKHAAALGKTLQVVFSLSCLVFVCIVCFFCLLLLLLEFAPHVWFVLLLLILFVVVLCCCVVLLCVLSLW